MDTLNLLATYEDYIFNAGSTEYVDEEGIKHTGDGIIPAGTVIAVDGWPLVSITRAVVVRNCSKDF